MMKSILALFILFFTLFNDLNAQKVKGICAEKGILYILENKVLTSYDIKTGNQLVKKSFKKDTMIHFKLKKNAAKRYAIHGDFLLQELDSALKKYVCLNVSAHKGHIYVSILFQLNNDLSKFRFGMLKFDTLLRFNEAYIINDINNNDFKGFNNYHPFEFNEQGHVILMYNSQNDSSKFKYSGYLFDEKKLILNQTYYATNSFKYFKRHVLFSNFQFLNSPNYFPVLNSNLEYVYQFPYPLFYNIQNNSYIDPYTIKEKLDSINKVKYRNTIIYNGLNFEELHKEYGRMVLAAKQIEGVIYAVVSNTDKNKTDFIKHDLKTNKSIIKTLDYPLANYHYVFNNTELIQCIYKEGKMEIKTIKWE